MTDGDISSVLNSLSESDIENLKKTAESIFGNKSSEKGASPSITSGKDALKGNDALNGLLNTGLPDMSVITKLSPVINELTKPDERASFIAALKPMLKPERQKKADEAVKLLKLLSLIPILKNKGLL